MPCHILFKANFPNCSCLNHLPHELRAHADESASAMSGKGCQLLVSPCSVSPSLSMIRGHQSQSVRTSMSSPQRASLSPSVGIEKVKSGAIHSFASGKQGRSHVVLPTLSLRRQVLTNGKHANMQTPSPHQHTTTTTTATATIQTGLCSSNNSFKGNKKKVKNISECNFSLQNFILALQNSGCNPQLKTNSACY